MSKNIKLSIIFHIIASILSFTALIISCVIGDVVFIVFSSLACVSVICSTVFIFREKYSSDLPILEQVRNFISGGYVEFFVDDNLTIYSCTPSLVRHLGYNEADFKRLFDDSFLRLVVPEDREFLLSRLKSSSNILKTQQLRFRIIAEQQRIIPVIAQLTYSLTPQKFAKQYDCYTHILVRCLIIDFTSVKNDEIERSIEAERYKVIVEQSDSIIFDYNIKERIIFVNNAFEKKFGYKIMPGADLRNILSGDDGITHAEDAEKIISLISSTEATHELVLRIKKFDGSYIWCKLVATLLFGPDTQPVRVVGRIIDIDVSFKEKELLLERTLRDPLTGLYNKIATENMVQECLITAPPLALFSFVLFDLDNFKHINDNFGHICGDRVLSKVTTTISSLLRSSDIIGRIGGDEFVVLIRDLPNELHAIKKVASILSSICSAFTLENDGFLVSASAGIAFFSSHGTSYLELFEKADKSLYKVKNGGKNAYAVYSEPIPKHATQKTRIYAGTDKMGVAK
ncbi:MAG: sensor domain-containing diguanylate cyclase [Christensenellaceae bacterium]|jgi:diguanylate cyclase (GGDEF)-like protein/PAS domain S-box-containing protein|nr:sensor domain-containing diguanylate cyclase [Christensenellaceae bacterium]